jgi:nucleotide-binding universal stress UspA family protein
MTHDQKSTVFALALLLAMFLQVLFVFADQMDTPGRATVQFAKAYYSLDPSMRKLLCSEALENEEADILDEFLSKASEEATARGYDTAYLRSKLLHLETHTTYIDENTAAVRITGARKRLIHPVFTWVAQIFLLGETYPLDQTFQVVKEGGRWKICEKELPLPAV